MRKQVQRSQKVTLLAKVTQAVRAGAEGASGSADSPGGLEESVGASGGEGLDSSSEFALSSSVPLDMYLATPRFLFWPL